MFCVKCVDRPTQTGNGAERNFLKKLIRSFIAVPLTDQIHQNLAEFSNQHGLDNRAFGLKPVKPANIHLTMKFLGEIEESQTAKLSAALDKVSTGLLPFKVTIRGIGAFPAWNRNPRIIWVGADPVEPLQKIYSCVESVTTRLGFPPESRGFSPHLTLARVNTQTDQLASQLKRLSQLTPEPFFGEMMVECLVLFKSVLLPQGPVYTALSSHMFTK